VLQTINTAGERLPKERLIVALDAPDADQARALVRQLGDAAGFYKVGKELFTAVGPAIVRELVTAGKRVFLDLKFHDIPNTVAGAVRSAAALGVSMLTVHAAGGAQMLKAASEAAEQSQTRPTVLAVTVLTSLTDAELQQTGVSGGVEAQVLRLASLAIQSGCGGLVASAQEAARLRQSLGSRFTLVTPGIRPAGGESADQARVVTPGAAIRSGADYLVVGRPITQAGDPRQAAQAIVEEIELACGAGGTLKR
jgi:orotidine-5'-phosphate decarboxylase